MKLLIFIFFTLSIAFSQCDANADNQLDVLELHHDGHIRFNVNSAGEFTFIAP